MKSIPKNPVKFGIFISKLHKKWAILALIASFAATTIGQYNIIVLRNLTDALAASNLDSANVWKWAILYAVIFFIAETIWRLSGFTGMRWFMNFRATAYQQLYDYLSLHSKDYFNSRFAGSLANKISNAVDGTQALFEQILWQFLPISFGLVLYIIFAWFSNVLLGLIICAWSIIFISINIIFAKKLQPRSMKSADAMSALKGKVVDSLTNISLVHEYAYVGGESEYINKYVKKSYRAGLAHWQLSEWMLFGNGIMLFVFMFLMISVSTYLFQMKSISVGVVIMIITIVGTLANQLLFLGQEIRNAAKFYGEAKEGLLEILKEHIIVDVPGAGDLKITGGTINFNSVDFNYEQKKIFESFSMHIPKGQKIGLVGQSGAGKSTLASLLLRHYDIQKGAIRIDDQDISTVTLESLRRAIGFVPQDTSMFHRTIRENIGYSSPESSNSDIIKAAKLAKADEFIQLLPKGYETLVGERGVKLSGGQRQRIAIARAFLKDAPILILDEATSSLDSESEQVIQESLEHLMQNRTVIAIAHRLSTLKKMDRIVVIEDGEIVEDGTPDELLQKENGFFKNLWDHQVKGFIVDD